MMRGRQKSGCRRMRRPFIQEIPHHPSIPFPKDPRNPLKNAVETVKLKIIKKYE